MDMKKLRNIMFVFLLLTAVIVIVLCLLFNHYFNPVDSDDNNIVTVELVNGPQIGESLEKAGLIRSATFYKIYLKLFNVDSKQFKAGIYQLKKSMSLKEIIDKLKEGSSYNPDEITITFQEGITMRKVASIIASNTNNTEDDVMNLLKDTEYLKSLINEYWFITDAILDSKIYYSLEGYLFPETYKFNNKEVSVKEIFEKMLKQMDSILTPNKEKIENNKYNVHEILTLASLSEKEVRNKEDYREKVVSVFTNRLNRGMSLGSDVTTRYALKIDDHTKPLTRSQYATVSPYNTRNANTAGKLPPSPISTVSENSIKAVLDAPDTDYIYFIANIQTGETFFYTNSREFEAKKAELSRINGGL